MFLKQFSLALPGKTVCAAAIASATASAAQATPFAVTYIGTVSSDEFNDFLSGGQSAAGDSYSETYVADPATPNALTNNTPGYSYAYGYYASDPVLSDILTIAGQRFSFVPSSSYFSGGVEEQESYSVRGINLADDQLNAYGASGSYSFTSNIVYNYDDTDEILPAVYGGNGSYAVQPSDTAVGEAEIYNGVSGFYDYLDLVPSEVIFGTLPEPATWGMMIAGFALVGTMIRRRRTNPAVSYA